MVMRSILGWVKWFALGMGTSVALAQAPEMTEAEVRKVDKDASKITLRHGEIKNLEMPPMTMVFRVKDKSVLDRFKPGDKVRFVAAKEGGAYVVTQIDSAE